MPVHSKRVGEALICDVPGSTRISRHDMTFDSVNTERGCLGKNHLANHSLSSYFTTAPVLADVTIRA